VAKSRSKSSSRRRSTAAGPKRGTSKKRASGPRMIQLKPLYNEISRVLKQLQQAQKRRGPVAVRELGLAEEAALDPVSLAIDRLTQHQRDFASICGNTMAVPA
jgi:hypothetical protein